MVLILKFRSVRTSQSARSSQMSKPLPVASMNPAALESVPLVWSDMPIKHRDNVCVIVWVVFI